MLLISNKHCGSFPNLQLKADVTPLEVRTLLGLPKRGILQEGRALYPGASRIDKHAPIVTVLQFAHAGAATERGPRSCNRFAVKFGPTACVQTAAFAHHANPCEMRPSCPLQTTHALQQPPQRNRRRSHAHADGETAVPCGGCWERR